MNTAMITVEPERRRRNTAQRRAGRNFGNLYRRAIAAVVVGLLGGAAITHIFAFQIRSTNSAAAHMLAPYDGRITALAAAFRADTNADAADRRAADALARQALLQDPTAVVAASTLGLNAEVAGDKRTARKLFAYAEWLSRREMQTQLWAIEDAVGQGNVEQALLHYDLALRTTPSLSQMLFPILASASTDAEIRPGLLKKLSARPEWGSSFIVFLSANSLQPNETAQFLISLRKLNVPIPDSASVNLVNTLLSSNAPEAAWDYYATTNKGVSRRISRDPRFAADVNEPTPFDWIVGRETMTDVSIQRQGRFGVVDFAAPAMVGGVLLQQLQLLPPGKYQLHGHSAGIDQDPAASPYWALTCRGGQEIGRIAITNSTIANGSFGGTFNVPERCPVQVLSLVAKPSERASGSSGQIDFVQLR